jgi:hypothetical protein
MRKFFRTVIGIGGGLALFLPLIPAQALTVQPATVEIQVDPGKGDVKNLKLTNDAGITETYVVTIQKFVPSGVSGQQEFLPLSDTKGLPEWMYVDKPSMTLRPGESSNLQVSLRVPPSVAPGGYYAALFLSKVPAPGEPMAMLPRVGVLFFVRVNGDVQEHLTLDSVSVDKASYDFLPVGFRVSITNDGMVHETPVGTVTIKNFLGQEVATFPANPDAPDAGRVLPASTRIYQSAWTKGDTHPVTGYFDGLQQELANFAIGPYVATVTFSGSGFSSEVAQQVRFSVWPWRTLLAAGILLIVLICLFLGVKKLIIKRATSTPS